MSVKPALLDFLRVFLAPMLILISANRLPLRIRGAVNGGHIRTAVNVRDAIQLWRFAFCHRDFGGIDGLGCPGVGGVGKWVFW